MGDSPASKPLLDTSDRNLHHLTPRELVAELLEHASIASSVLATKWPDTLMAIAHMTEVELAYLLGLTPGPARRLAAALELHRRLVNWSVPVRPIIKRPEDAVAVLAPLCSYPEEHFWCLALDVRCRLISSPLEISHGDVDGTDAGPRAFFRAAVKMGATSAIAVHNHPTGDLSPSDADLAVTKRLAQAGLTIDVRLADHLIVAPDRRWISIRIERPDCFR